MRVPGAHLLALSDDLTGALEAGGQFYAWGLRSLVTTEGVSSIAELGGRTGALVMDAETRHLPAAEAAGRVRRLADAARQSGVSRIYKKTDSTLRGNIAAEFQALLDVYPGRPLVYVPGYPKLGRTVVDGLLYVDGQPLAQSAFADDPLEPARESSILELLSRGSDATIVGSQTPAHLAELLSNVAGPTVIVCDSRRDEDLEGIASVLGRFERPCLVAGTGGFAGYWAGSLPLPRAAARHKPSAQHCLALIGSLHPDSREQLRHAAASGWMTFELPAVEEHDVMLVEGLEAAVSHHRSCVLATPDARLEPPLALPARMGRMVSGLLDRVALDGLVIFGGDTVFGVLTQLGCTVIEPCGELFTGIPVSVVRVDGREIALVTKAGGFGPPDVLCAIAEAIAR